ncbi:MAG: hypothetical protein RLP09_32390 [Sandaracinaceae bacterium]
MNTLRILHVEDELWKARCVQRIIQAEARRLGLTLVFDHRASPRFLPDTPEVGFDAVVTDWHLGSRCGSEVVAWAQRRRLHVVVISGGDAPADWTDTAARRWAGTDWGGGARWLLHRAGAVHLQQEHCG